MKALIFAAIILMFGACAIAADPEQRLKEAIDEYHKGDIKKAHELFEVYLLDYPADITALEYLGIIELKLGRPDKARFHFLRVLERRPDSVQALVGMGHVECAQNKGFACQDYYEKAAKLSPTREITDLVIQAQKANTQRIAQEKAEKRLRLLDRITRAFHVIWEEEARLRAIEAERIRKAEAGAPKVNVYVPVNVWTGR
ncbi:MAG: hypothetical protein LDL33_10385 [Desulfomonile sp.]|nr:hypothetical protein [Desulfomonile sp.]